MNGFPLPERVFVYGRPVDMRKSFDGLFSVVTNGLGEDPMSGDLYLFLNRRRNFLKGLLWDRTGFLIIAKRLERGQFHLRNGAEKVVIERALLRRLLDGVAVGGVEISRSKNFQDGPRDSSTADDPGGSSRTSASQL
jgi:transposase